MENQSTKQKKSQLKEDKDIETRRVWIAVLSHEFIDLVVQKEINDLINEFKEQMSQHTTIFKDMSSVLKNLLKVCVYSRLIAD